MLTKAQVETYTRDGFVIIPKAISSDKLQAMRDELDKWIEESKSYKDNYGKTPNGKARFDLEKGHCAENPKLRRVANPADISQAYRDVLFEGPAVKAVVDLIGPNVKFHHCKLNIKLPGMKTRVDYHQDQPFDVHTNDDHLALLVLIDDMNEENGCVRILKGSHNGPRYSHYERDEFVGKVDEDIQKKCRRYATKIEGKAGDICLMSTWCLHGGTANLSQSLRRMLICDYTTADNYPLMQPIVPSEHTGRIVAGKATRQVRFREGVLELPKHYESDSFFGAQGQKGVQKEIK
jgi:ectoine hydroxylase-related dioxygenase (phytanoyl-CoA dioxygenase family)